ncbi:hypothetical protein GGX14DRAFT_398360 [Mycena pura]|uniref:Uncharacterized protein n=1 Tax=Mycena pura TaxID=153505 RepID=A0AAD6V719_9AGAR|nr:hypothetical protein GGX14DRAFT_398360 [Mycena pura]
MVTRTKSKGSSAGSSRSKGVLADENTPLGQRPSASKNTAKEVAARIAGHIDPYSDEMDVKFNIEGSAVQEVVFLRQSNDLAQQKILDQAAANAALADELAMLKARVTADITNQQGEAAAAAAGDKEGELSDALARAKAANAVLRKQVEKLTAPDKVIDDAVDMVPRPAGSAGKDYNIQDEMGLGRKPENREIYKGLMRNTRDLTLQAGINWELPWAKTPAEAKAKLYAVARERHPILKRYVNDWATEELVKQYIKYNQKVLGWHHQETCSGSKTPYRGYELVLWDAEESVSAWAETLTGHASDHDCSYENSVLTATSRAVLRDIRALGRAVNIPRPSLRLQPPRTIPRTQPRPAFLSGADLRPSSDSLERITILLPLPSPLHSQLHIPTRFTLNEQGASHTTLTSGTFGLELRIGFEWKLEREVPQASSLRRALPRDRNDSDKTVYGSGRSSCLSLSLIQRFSVARRHAEVPCIQAVTAQSWERKEFF